MGYIAVVVVVGVVDVGGELETSESNFRSRNSPDVLGRPFYRDPTRIRAQQISVRLEFGLL